MTGHSTAKRSKMVAVGREAHLRLAPACQRSTPEAVAEPDRPVSATPFGVEKPGEKLTVRRCASRPTATICDPFGIKKLCVKTRAKFPLSRRPQLIAARREPRPPAALVAAALLLLFAGPPAHAQQTLTDSSGQTYRLIEANHFEMGARQPEEFRMDHSDYNTGQDDQPIHPVILSKPFYIATTEVTVAQFKQFVKETSYQTTAEVSGAGIVGWDPVDNDRGEAKSSFTCQAKFTWRDPGFPQADSHPVVGVSFDDAKAYCSWLSNKENASYRLPTEAEWECACRAGSETYFAFGDQYRNLIHRYANIGNVELERQSPGRVTLQWLVDVDNDPEDGHVFTSPVASYEPNAWGLYDLHGNVWEWCEDRYLDTFYTQFDRDGHQQVRRRAVDPVCDQRWNEHGDWRVIRGGSWFVSPIQCRSGVRSVFEQRDAACYVGFRVVREASQERIAASIDRFQNSEAALDFVRAAARETREEHNGHLKFSFPCDSLTPEILARLADLEYSVELDIHPPGQLTADLIANVAKVGRLAGLKISVGGKVVSADFAPLAAHPELQWVQITGSGNLDDGLLDHFRKATSLRSISLQGSGITDQGLAKLPELSQLESFHVAGTQSTGQTLKRFAASPLREVSFGHLTDQGAENLRSFDSMVSINARNSPLGRAGLDAVTSLRQLRTLQLEGCGELTDDDFRYLQRLAKVDRVDLARTQAGDRAAEAMRDLLQLRDLRIGSEFLSDAGMQAICGIVSLQALMITAEANQITNSGLADFWRLVNLRSLHLEPRGITGDGLATLAELPRLTQLSLNNVTLSDQSIRHLVAIENLKELFIGRMHSGETDILSDDGLLRLAGCESLEKLTLQKAGTKVTDEGIEQLKRRCPNLRVSIR